MRVVLILALSVQCVSGAECFLGWREFKGWCYSFSEEDVTWLDALAHCSGYTSRLVIVDSAEKDKWLIEQLQVLNYVTAWTGGTSRGHSGTYIWAPSYKRFGNYQNWANGQPDNPTGELCVELRRDFSNKWNNIHCMIPNRFICEKKKPLE